jgi:hypothetical protein
MSQRLSIFVVMAFDKKYRDIYELGIKAACVDAGADCERVDEQLFLENILERIYGQIEKADLIVAEMSGRNSNVYYEVGYAHGIGKEVILLTSEASDIPFDFKHYPHIVYDGQILKLKTELYKRILWCIEHPELLKWRRKLRNPDDVDLDDLRIHIVNYLIENNYTKISFERITTLMGATEQQIRNLISQEPTKFRFALIKGKHGTKPGIGLIGTNRKV